MWMMKKNQCTWVGIWRQLKWNQNKEMEEMTNENLKIKYFHFA